MTKPFIKQREFSLASSERSKPHKSYESSALEIDYLNQVHFFETMRSYGGKIFSCREHVKRLRESCVSAGLVLDRPDLEQWLNESLTESAYKDALIRVSWHPLEGSRGKLVLIIRPFLSHPEALYKKGVSLKTVAQKRWAPRAQDPQIKTSQYVNAVLATLDNLNQTFHELVFFGDSGFIAEGSVSNIFIFKEKRLLTPESASGILRGVTRDFVIRLAKKRGFEVRETFLTRHEIYTADECFMTNTSSEILPVIEVDSRKIGAGRPGERTTILRKLFKEETGQ